MDSEKIHRDQLLKMRIGDTIHELRKRASMTQLELSMKCDLTQATLSQIETGVTYPSRSTIKRLCKELGLSESTLYLLSIEEADVPFVKRKLFKEMFPSVKAVLIEMLTDQ